jgi:hypothetical protein
MENIWPNNHEVSIICLTGDFGAGKTSWAVNLDPVLKGKGESRTLVFDMENSSEALANNYELDRVDVPEATKEKYGDSWTVGQLYQNWWKMADEMTKAKEYSVLIIDDFAPLQEGAFAVATGNDTMMKWANTKNDLESKLRLLSTRVQTVVIISHLRNKKDNSKEKEMKGVDTLKKMASLVLYLHRDPSKMIKIKGVEMQSCPKYPYPSGIVLKSRLEKVVDEKDEYGDYKRAPLIPDRIPVCTPGAIRKYMLNPAVEFTAEEGMPDEIPGLVEPTTEDERTSAAITLSENELKVMTEKGKARLMKSLVDDGLYPNEAAIHKAAKQIGVKYSLEDHDKIYEQLAEAVK